MTNTPVQDAAASVADTERLIGGVTAPLDRGKREAHGARANGGWDRGRGDGEGDGDRDRWRPVGPQCDLASIGSGEKRAGCDADSRGASSRTRTWRVP